MAIVLGPGGALAPFLQLVKRGKISRLGNGKQLFSWVHIRDLAHAIEWIFADPELSGSVNIAAPEPLPNRAFLGLLGERTGIKPWLPVPAPLLELGALLRHTETELILKSRWVLPAKLQDAGFLFEFPRMQDALADLLDEQGNFRALTASRPAHDN